MADAPASSPSDVLYCTVHPTVETNLRCNKCGRPMCIKCARRTPVGYRCKECVANQQQVFYNSQTFDPVIQGAISIVLSSIAAFFAGIFGGGLLGFFIFLIGIPVSSAIGVFIADLAHRAAGRRRGRYSWLVVGGGIVVGALIVAILPGLFIMLLAGFQMGAAYTRGFGLGAFTSIGWWVYTVVATASAVGRLRMGK
jgi:hypothetical protein